MGCQPAPRPATPAHLPQSPTVEPTLPPLRTALPTPAPEPTITSTLVPTAALPTAAAELPGAVIAPENTTWLEQIGEIRYDPWELVLALAWSPNEDLLAVSASNSIFLYNGSDLSQGQVLQVGSWTSGLAFSPDGGLLAAGSRDGELRIWRRTADAQAFSARPVLQWTAHKKGINQVAFSPDGLFIASGGNEAIARVWRVGDGSLERQMIGGTFSVTALAFRPEAGDLAIVNGSLARLRALDTGRIGVTLRGDAPLFSLAFNPNGSRIATGNLQNQLQIWETDTGESLAILEPTTSVSGATAAFSGQVSYSPDGRLLGATASDGSIRLWESESARLLFTLNGHSLAATCLAFSPDQDRLVSGGLDAAIRIWGIR